MSNYEESIFYIDWQQEMLLPRNVKGDKCDRQINGMFFMNR